MKKELTGKLTDRTKGFLDTMGLGCIGQCDTCPSEMVACITDHKNVISQAVNELDELLKNLKEKK